MNRKKVLKRMVLFIPYYADGTDRQHKCAGCGANILAKKGNIHPPYHFLLCERCRIPVWRLLRWFKSGKLRVID